ncbi:hypothetical protein BHE90_011976 [Fusarium euwallaceae]|uniref:Uncharacterized protein n=3 Tax=Fusarium solani species complex TaxID=232080 RepID=A0A3M2SAB4_9HYPO|nr:hypothetical protein CDV36_005847 [Fusarium kuroshium]RSL79616.1 hypothetical protein CEP51_007229 [Fusarium floridanum]RTE73596.1 hypothetical protein BHE90_011976 [Fusarium euwallaceae]
MSSKHHVCYVEDAEEDSGSSHVEGIESTRRYAVSEAPVSSSYKERPNTGKSRGDKRYSSNRRSDSSPSDGLTDSDDYPRREERQRRNPDREDRNKEQRRKERKQKEAAVQQQRKVRTDAKAVKEREPKPARKRPTSLSQSRTEPVVQQYRRGHVEDPSCYGIQQPAVTGRPRAQTRPNSYYPGQAGTPPIAHAGWHHAQHSQPSFPTGSFPPPPVYPGAPSPSVIGVPPSPGSQHGGPGFFDMPSGAASAHLRGRFERPASSIGFRQPPPPSAFGYPQDEPEEEPDPRLLARRASRSKKHQQQQHEDDRRAMPPPAAIPRPKSALPPTTPFRPPPQQVLSRPKPRTPSRPPPTRNARVGFADPRGFDDEDLASNADLFQDMSPEPNYNPRSQALTRTRRPSVAYEQPGVDIMPARRRRESFYGPGPDRALGGGGVSLEEDKYMDALRYQDDINGGPAMPLTAETLRKASNPRLTGGSSRSTRSRSSDSRDESEYKRSNTTGLTRSSSSDTDNLTIKVSGSAVVRVPGAEIQCADGGEITFTSRTGGSRVGSDRASTIYQIEDVRSRPEQKALPYRARAPSQSDSHRHYAPSHAPYDPTFANDDYIY